MTDTTEPFDPASRTGLRGGLPDDDLVANAFRTPTPYWWLPPEERAAKLKDATDSDSNS